MTTTYLYQIRQAMFSLIDQAYLVPAVSEFKECLSVPDSEAALEFNFMDLSYHTKKCLRLQSQLPEPFDTVYLFISKADLLDYVKRNLPNFAQGDLLDSESPDYYEDYSYFSAMFLKDCLQIVAFEYQEECYSLTNQLHTGIMTLMESLARVECSQSSDLDNLMITNAKYHRIAVALRDIMSAIEPKNP